MGLLQILCPLGHKACNCFKTFKFPYERELLHAYRKIYEFYGTHFTNLKAFSFVRYFRYIFPEDDYLIHINMLKRNK